MSLGPNYGCIVAYSFVHANHSVVHANPDITECCYCA